MSKQGTLQRNGLPARLRAYFVENPDEELTYEDAIAKFDVFSASVSRAVETLPEIEYVKVIRLKQKRGTP